MVIFPQTYIYKSSKFKKYMYKDTWSLDISVDGGSFCGGFAVLLVYIYTNLLHFIVWLHLLIRTLLVQCIWWSLQITTSSPSPIVISEYISIRPVPCLSKCSSPHVRPLFTDCLLMYLLIDYWYIISVMISIIYFL